MSTMNTFWHHLLQADTIRFFVTMKCRKIKKADENWLK